jgi:hypothetical protein
MLQREERAWDEAKYAATMPSLLSLVVRIILRRRPPATTAATEQRFHATDLNMNQTSSR